MDDKLDIQWGQEGYITYLVLSGSLDSDTSDHFDQIITKFIEVGHRKIVLDLGGLKYLSSAGIGVLVGSANELRENDGDLKLSAVPDNIARVLDMLALLDFFEAYPDCRTAMNTYSS